MPGRWTGSTRASRLPPGWRHIRQRVLTRDGHRCQISGPTCTHVATEVDHREPGDDHHLDNLQAVCRACHAAKTAAEGNAAQPRRRRHQREHHPGATGGDTPSQGWGATGPQGT